MSGQLDGATTKAPSSAVQQPAMFNAVGHSGYTGTGCTDSSRVGDGCAQNKRKGCTGDTDNVGANKSCIGLNGYLGLEGSWEVLGVSQGGILKDVGSKLTLLGSCWCYVAHFGQQDEPRWRPRGCKIEPR